MSEPLRDAEIPRTQDSSITFGEMKVLSDHKMIAN